MYETETIFDRAKTVGALAAAERYAHVVPNGARRVTVRCPIHNERTPSCVFYPDGTFHCFGCSRGGTSIDLVMALFRVNALEAAQKICADFGIDPGEPMDADRKKRLRDLKDMRAAAQRAASFTHAVQCGVIRWCDDRLEELDRRDDSAETEAALESLLTLRTDASHLADAIESLDQARRGDDLEQLLRSVYDMSVERYRVLQNWDETQGTRYVRAVEP